MDLQTWQAVPFHFWSVTIFVFGSMVGSFLNVCIYRMPREESVISPPSHCPRCQYSIPWYLNIPIFTWLVLRGRCANCRTSISIRYLVVEFVTGAFFLTCWLIYGPDSPGLALVFGFFIAGLLCATFIDFEHFIIPDEITIGGIFAGIAASLMVKDLHGAAVLSESLKQSLIGAAAGAGIVYAILRGGKLLFGKEKIEINEGDFIRFSETSLELPDREVPYEDIFYRKSDAITLTAKSLKLTPKDLTGDLPTEELTHVEFALTPNSLTIEGQQYNPEQVSSIEVVTEEIILPREAMGLGDVKFMAAIGAFIGWKGALFSLMASSVLGSIVGIALILLKKQEWSSRLPYGPYIAIAALIWVFFSPQIAPVIFPPMPDFYAPQVPAPIN